MKNFQNQYRIASTRIQAWDYGSRAAYFITICTEHREPWFGSVSNGKMELSEIGKIVSEEWIRTGLIRIDMNITLDEFVVMPDHFHAILNIGRNKFNGPQGGLTKFHSPNDPWPESQVMNQFGPQSKNLASIVRGFKSAVTTRVRKNGNHDFCWQPGFYDRILSDEYAIKRVRQYIIDNPKKWKSKKR